jgi:hypothetical protein
MIWQVSKSEMFLALANKASSSKDLIIFFGHWNEVLKLLNRLAIQGYKCEERKSRRMVI